MEKIEQVYSKIEPVNDKWFVPRQKLRSLHSGNTFIRKSNVDLKTIFEGQGLEKFTGAFRNLDSFKGPTNVDSVTIPHKPKLSKENLDKLTEKLRRQIYG